MHQFDPVLTFPERGGDGKKRPSAALRMGQVGRSVNRSLSKLTETLLSVRPHAALRSLQADLCGLFKKT
jgi:hypothetical protein